MSDSFLQRENSVVVTRSSQPICRAQIGGKTAAQVPCAVQSADRRSQLDFASVALRLHAGWPAVGQPRGMAKKKPGTLRRSSSGPALQRWIAFKLCPTTAPELDTRRSDRCGSANTESYKSPPRRQSPSAQDNRGETGDKSAPFPTAKRPSLSLCGIWMSAAPPVPPACPTACRHMAHATAAAPRNTARSHHVSWHLDASNRDGSPGPNSPLTGRLQS